MARDAVDLFCGCGGLSRGLDAAGFDVVAGIDSWTEAMKVYKANNERPGHDCILQDLSDEEKTIEIVSRYRPFLIAGGPPCQDFSSAGNRTEGDRADLTVKFANVVSAVRPTTFIMENVSRAQHSDAFALAKEILKEAGYGLTLVVLNSSLCGVPQIRKRLFLIGMLGEPDGFLYASIKAGLSKKPMTMREYFGDEMPFDHYYRHPRTYERRGIYSMDEPSPTIRGVNRPMPGNYQHHANDAVPPSEAVKALTMDQRARVQTFPAGYFDVKLSKKDKDQMIGNAVPVEMAKFVSGKLIAYVDAKFSWPVYEDKRMKDIRAHAALVTEAMAASGRVSEAERPALELKVVRAFSDSLPALEEAAAAFRALSFPARHPVPEPMTDFKEAAE